jgi:hypothetical protein
MFRKANGTSETLHRLRQNERKTNFTAKTLAAHQGPAYHVSNTDGKEDDPRCKFLEDDLSSMRYGFGFGVSRNVTGTSK